MDALLGDTHVWATILGYVQRHDVAMMACVNKTWSKAVARPQVWEVLAQAPRGPFLASCFRRASSYAYRETDVPAPNVNRRGAPPTIRGCLLSDRSTLKDYINELRAMYYETQNLAKTPVYLAVPDALYDDAASVRTDRPFTRDEWRRAAFQSVALIQSPSSPLATHVLTGTILHDTAFFYLWHLKEARIVATIYHALATCFDTCAKMLVIGASDGTVKTWDLAAAVTAKTTSPVRGLAPTSTLAPRSHIGLAPFLPTRANQRHKPVKVQVDVSEGSFVFVAATYEKGDVSVWNATKAELTTSLSVDSIHKSTLPRAARTPAPQVTSLMLFRNTLVCGTSVGLVRVFDTRDARLSHRISGHPDAIVKTLTRGRVLWSAGRDGSVRWWGGKSPKVLPKSLLCEGPVSHLEMDESVVVAAYGTKGMQAWDVRTQQPLTTFGATDGVDSVVFDKRKLVSLSPQGVVHVWRWFGLYPVHTFPTQHVYTAVAHDERHLVLGTTDGAAVLYRMEGIPSKKPPGALYDY
ncbi:hypothetical protein SDRG_11868 [Saprolegnia diclina VS20]|uniref:Uncharacterized protein n=1 Tax=Saprolegnia diclina (strain VS20) TaxID=1156394 RepID=T0Q6Q7_SAPDV|nr:hypothetical protein SDRG_11868 [Saprolegnia diclina VS20]EQC30291.1 hypothetical protein SDRG_11868 [Saprolegnia diclina VS20]|eukprot:XP_008616144.1 hypothetical protein SDRG_11868 [Saprolegnia diclina VS20]